MKRFTIKPFFQPKVVASGLFAGLLGSLSPNAARAGDKIFVTDTENGTVGEYTTSGATVNAALIPVPGFPAGEGLPAGIAIANIPEASTWVMSLTGFAALAFAGYRRARSKAVSA
jgi:hypothetical protein